MINKKKTNKIKVIPLGGLGEIGKNLTVFEYENEIIVIDCGMSFPNEELLGIDLIIPDITYLIKNREKIKGFFITHGHEDHIGGLPYVLKQINAPIYATKLTLGLIESKLQEHKILDDCTLNIVKPKDVIEVGNFKVEFIKTNHSIADSVSIALHTPAGIIVHTGDFKIDFTPIDGETIDLQRYAQLGKRGVLLLMADSTNATRLGYTMSEKTVGEALENLFMNANGRVIVATFASNIHRVQQIANASVKNNRKIAFSGRSMERICEVAMELGYLFIPKEMIIDLNETKKYSNDRVTIITTGSQGEPMAALTRIASGTHKNIRVEKGDMVIISATPIPGNQKAVSDVINDLIEKGANVIYESIKEIHVSGHACEEELKLIQTLIKPKFFMPIHGEHMHLINHSKIAENMGMKKSNIFVLETGDVLELSRNKAQIAGKVQAGRVLIDGIGVGDVGNIVLKDRKNLANEGILTIVIAINRESRTIVSGPDIITRGFVYVRDSEGLIKEISEVVIESIEKCFDNNETQWTKMKNTIRREVNNFIYNKIKRKPMILPTIIEI
ncbi:ribonuclease J [Clostridium saccharobutylicum]|uniref:Ribonuclease J n=1 Tax=Clostridium saccharobutylicum DSM 13864 TaxID=1345695 RepID=U5MRL2_CLOSA|nr:ribonuclease J [Clostridium saccharobutylicum]AGX43250.1 ribonuclease J 1 [Clostridium saccharobutylicum DSM 13864]AQR90549.1 ribonuclease J 1 [Clostridium saccharobutylicum]AQS00453.1 ribonuclease J 1 [Clostridium saccharobutylicum]AQS10102.1 ribonuclease J 1 [Clostridium saccharobutylicum]AQS14436.1 ribonuclease J 1 [Clostridium saccharobutylicum]